MHISWVGARTKPQPALFISALPHLQLISSCLNLPCGTQGWSRRLNPFFYNQEMGNTERLLYLGGPNRVLLGSNPPFSLILLTLEGNRCWTRKGIRKVNHKLSRGILVYWDSHSGPLLALLLSLPPSCFFLIISFHWFFDFKFYRTKAAQPHTEKHIHTVDNPFGCKWK